MKSLNSIVDVVWRDKLPMLIARAVWYRRDTYVMSTVQISWKADLLDNPRSDLLNTEKAQKLGHLRRGVWCLENIRKTGIVSSAFLIVVTEVDLCAEELGIRTSIIGKRPAY
ncbi:hypothetical protein N7478_009385 [Penicillium angulare]|uniref:uncharacterized protein n=1 Tax=Penicillium angulare TaxID=116970 RepID=UPI002540D726|nr:uncharacterized protein N7478_009385 [Penicillium angulare]KAJ5266577.1 hypothetical protein N7478_009385 [Penicillium angulare]